MRDSGVGDAFSDCSGIGLGVIPADASALSISHITLWGRARRAISIPGPRPSISPSPTALRILPPSSTVLPDGKVRLIRTAVPSGGGFWVFKKNALRLKSRV